MNKRLLGELIDKYDIEILEYHIIRYYIEKTGLNVSNSELLIDFLKKNNTDEKLFLQVEGLGIDNLKDVETYCELLIPKNDRKLNGAFFTPTYIVDYIIEEVKPNLNSKCVDPSCGSGAFLLGLLRYYKRQFPNESLLEVLRNNIYGVDILPYNIKRGKLLLSIYLIESGVTDIIKDTDFNLLCEDSLRYNWTERFDIIVGNPPYVKFQDLSDENREFLVNQWESIEKGTFNLYFAFFELGYKLLSEEGRLGYITPNNYFTSLAGETLRGFFHKTKSIYKIIDFNHIKVFDVQTYTALTFLDNSKNENILFDRINGVSPEVFLNRIEPSKNPLENLRIKKWRLLKTEEQKNIKIIEESGTPLKSLFDIFVGIATLKDELFFLDENKQEGEYYLKTIEDETYQIEKSITKSIYKISDFKEDSDISKNTRKMIFPYRVVEGVVNPIAETDIKVEFPMCYKYFKSIEDKLRKRTKTDSIEPFYIYGRSQGLNKFGPRILTPTFSKYPRFKIVEEEDSLYCNGYGVFYKSTSNELFVNPISLRENMDVLNKILNSLIMDYYVKKTSVSIEGGYPCYQKNFIEKFSIPDFTQDEISTLRNLSDTDEINSFLVKKYQLLINIPSPNLSL